MTQLVSTRSFRRWPTPPGTSLSAMLRTGESRCGIYILEFAGGERYVGQSVDVVRRFADHRRRWDDIEAVQFLPVPAPMLDEVERQTVHKHVEQGVHLRNIQLLNTSWSPSTLDAEIDLPMQESWVTGAAPDPSEDPRTAIARRRLAMRPRYQRLLTHPQADMILADLTAYVRDAIIWPSHTVEARWTVSVFPSTGRSRDQQRVICVNCGLVETFVVLEDRTTQECFWFMNLDPAAIRSRDLPRELRPCYETTEGYRSAGKIGRLVLDTAGDIAELMEEVPALKKGARSLALGLMRKQPAMFARSHCDDLADDILVALAARAQ